MGNQSRDDAKTSVQYIGFGQEFCRAAGTGLGLAGGILTATSQTFLPFGQLYNAATGVIIASGAYIIANKLVPLIFQMSEDETTLTSSLQDAKIQSEMAGALTGLVLSVGFTYASLAGRPFPDMAILRAQAETVAVATFETLGESIAFEPPYTARPIAAASLG